MVITDGGLASRLYQNQELRETLSSLSCGLLQLRIRVIHTKPGARLVVRDATLGGSEGLGILVEEFAEGFGRPELVAVPFLFWGHSAAGTFGLTYAGLDPGRTIGFVRYNSHLRDLPVDMSILTAIPGLLIAGGADEVAGTEDAHSLWANGRASDAPWAFAVQPGAPHSSEQHLAEANALLLPWMIAVIEGRLDSDAEELKDLSNESGWFAGDATGETVSFDRYLGPRQQASWLPDEASARGWQILSGTSR